MYVLVNDHDDITANDTSSTNGVPAREPTDPPAPPPAAMEIDSADSGANPAESSDVPSKPPAKAASNSDPFPEIHLDGEDTESTPIYSTCADIRRTITSHLKSTKTSQAAFARTLTSLLPSTKVPTRGLYRFMEASGTQAAGHNPAFYAAWVFFEKKRISEGKKKSDKRVEMEKIWGKKGFRRINGNDMKLTQPQGMNWSMDNFGRVEIIDESGKVVKVETPPHR